MAWLWKRIIGGGMKASVQTDLDRLVARRKPPPVSDAALATGFSGPDDSPGFLLWQVTNRWQAAQRAALKPHRLTHVQFVLLATLTWLDAGRPGDPEAALPRPPRPT